MNEPACLLIPGDVMQLSPNRRLHPLARARLAKEWRSRARLIWLSAGAPQFNVPVRISITLRRGRVVDPDNALSSMKSCLDGLSSGRPSMLPGDTAQWVEYAPVRIESGAQWKHREEVVISVTPRVMVTCS